MPTHFIDGPSLRRRIEVQEDDPSPSPEVGDWLTHSGRIQDLYREAENDLRANLEGSLKQGDIMQSWMGGTKGPAYVLGADMFAVIEEHLGLEDAVSVARDYRKFLNIYNSAARAGIQGSEDLFLFDEELARNLSEFK